MAGSPGFAVDAWTPVTMTGALLQFDISLENRGTGWLAMTARLREGVTAGQANAALGGPAARFPFPAMGRPVTIEVFAIPKPPSPLPVELQAGIEPAVLLFMLPAVQASRLRLLPALSASRIVTTGGPAQAKLRTAPVVTQVALSLRLLAGTGLLARSIRAALTVDPGFEISRGIVVDLNVAYCRYTERAFDEHDGPDSEPVAIVNATMARCFWAGRDPVGLSFTMHEQRVGIVGIAKDSKWFLLSERPQPFLYRPFFQEYAPLASRHVRTAGDPDAVMPAVLSVIGRLDPNLPISNAWTMERHMALSRYPTTIAAMMAGGFGVLAFGLAGACALGRALFSSGGLVEVGPADPAVLIGASLVVLAATMAASFAHPPPQE
jgi:hypothetical protein